MSKLLTILIAGVFATVSATGFAQEKKADAPKAEMKKDDTKKADKPVKKGAKKAKGKKSGKKSAAAKAEMPKK